MTYLPDERKKRDLTYARCPKCHGGQFGKARYISRSLFSDCEGHHPGEHLHYVCGQCGFLARTEVAS